MTGSLVPQLVTAPACYPVSLAEIRSQLGIETTETDAHLARLSAGATGLVEIWLNRSLITRTYKGWLSAWPCDGRGWMARELDLPRAPLISVTHVKTYDDDDVATTMDAADYYVDTGSVPGRVVLRSGASWTAPERVANGIEVQWVAGYGPNPADVPEEIRLGIITTIGWLNEQRGDETSPQEPPRAARELIEPHRIYSF